ncbi:MAG TPA: hypothetical protein VME69_07250 [Methylocella sp.]|nr:hypothetical protein [Methylocella sp.]
MTTTPRVHETERTAHRHQWLGALVQLLDRHLRHQQGVTEYTNSPDCIFRIQIVTVSEDFLLADATHVSAGERIIDLHFWNEHIPVMSGDGATLAWARRVNQSIEVSLHELARFLSSRPDLEDIRAIRGIMSLGSSNRSNQIARLAGHFGFERISPTHRVSVMERLHRLGENILISMLVLTRNPASLRMDTLWRSRTLTYLSRSVLEQRFYPDSPRAMR